MSRPAPGGSAPGAGRSAAQPADPPAVTAYLGLGSNLGDRRRHLREALLALATHPEIELQAVSGLWETEYVGPGSQPPYLNACAAVRTTLPAAVLLAVLKGAEARHGRPPAGHGRPRPLDLDILLYGEVVSAEAHLTLPHPRLRERAFVLEPLGELAPAKVLPDSGETVASACARIRQVGGPWVRRLADGAGWPRPGAERKDEWRAALALHRR